MPSLPTLRVTALRPRALAQVALALGIAAIVVTLGAQTPPDWAQRSRTFEEIGLKEPFKGVTAGGTVEPDLFTIRRTGVSTAPVVTAAKAFLETLTPAERNKTLFAIDDPEWRKWMNQHFYIRQGVGFTEMSEPQREAAIGLMRASLSARGLKLTRDIMHLNQTLGELNDNDFVQYGEWKYWITIMGTPSATEPWGWQLDGHHVIINYFVLRDQVVMTPTFIGSEPVTATSGQYAGTSVMQDEQNQGLAFMQSLPGALRAKATIAADKTANNNLTEAFKDNVVVPYAGVAAADLPLAAQQALANLIGLYVGMTDDGHAKVRMSDVMAQWSHTHFAWVGGTSADAVFYYRIHSPVILIEFDHQTPIGIRLPDGSRGPTRQHIHAVVRTPNGNDYGKDLLRQHLLTHQH